LPRCADPDYVSLGGNLATPILAADASAPVTAGSETGCAATPSSGPLTLDGGCPQPTPAAGVCDLGPAAVTLPDNCGERREVPCVEFAGYDPMPAAVERLDATFEALLLGCGERINVLKVQLEDGCVVRFELDNPRPGLADCVSSRLATERYACATGLSCGRGDINYVPTI
jgi:hypothetical protein